MRHRHGRSRQRPAASTLCAAAGVRRGCTGATARVGATIGELDDVLRCPKFDVYLSEERRLTFLAALLREAEMVDVVNVVTACRDPKDNKFLELAVSGRATHIVSGDTDLLVLHPFRGIAEVNPRAFLTIAADRTRYERESPT